MRMRPTKVVLQLETEMNVLHIFFPCVTHNALKKQVQQFYKFTFDKQK